MMSEKQLSILIQGRNYARGNRQIIRIPRAFACISAGAPWLWRSVMQIDKVSQEPAHSAISRNLFFHWKFIVSPERAHPARHAVCVPHWCNFGLMWLPWKNGSITVQTGRHTQSRLAPGWTENRHRTTRSFSIELLNFEWSIWRMPPSWSSSAPSAASVTPL